MPVEFELEELNAVEKLLFEEMLDYAQETINKRHCNKFEKCSECPVKNLCKQLMNAYSDYFDTL